jgi:undecaprenyl-diphosphatase
VELWKAALLGLVQGLTEFFPISSDGHLVALGRWLELPVRERGAAAVSFLHVGTLLACLVAFRAEVAAMLALVRAPRRLLSPPEGDETAQAGRFVLLGSLATAVAALPFLDLFEALYRSTPVLVSSCALTGALLLLAPRAMRLPSRPLDATQAVLVGCAQMLAILPGLSRSCTTVVVGLLVGIPAARVAGLSFLLSIPAVAGAVLMELLRHPPRSADLPAIAAGVAVSFVVGSFAVRSMLVLVPRGRLHWFAPYMFLFAAVVALATGGGGGR